MNELRAEARRLVGGNGLSSNVDAIALADDISFSDRSIDMILPTIKQYFGIMNDDRRFNVQ